MPMPQYNGPTYGYNPYQTYLPQSPWQGPQPYTQPQTAQLPVQQVQTQANPPLVGHIVTANDQIPVSEVQLAMTIDGTPLAETAMIETIGTANSYQNLAARTYLKVCPSEDVTLSVTNTGTEPVTIDANAAFTARRIA